MENVSELQQRVIDVWAGVPQSVIDDVIDQCPRRLHACVRASGGVEDILNIHCDINNISQNVINCNKPS